MHKANKRWKIKLIKKKKQRQKVICGFALLWGWTLGNNRGGRGDFSRRWEGQC